MNQDKPRPTITIKRKPSQTEATAIPAPEAIEPTVQVASNEGEQAQPEIVAAEPITVELEAVAELLNKLQIIKTVKPIAKGSDEILLEYARRKLGSNVSKRSINRFLAGHCRRHLYMKAIGAGGKRYNPVSGSPTEDVTTEEAESAKQRLSDRKAVLNALRDEEKKPKRRQKPNVPTTKPHSS
jgi:ribosomal protein L7/L12